MLFRLFFILVLLFSSLPLSGRSEEKDPLLKMGGEVRLRSETNLNFDAFMPGRSAVDDDSFILLRVRPYLESTPTEQVHLFIQPQFSRSFAQEESTLANGLNIDDFDLHQGYVDFQHLVDDHVDIRLGRQELAYGDERLIGALNWSNVGRSFDAGRIKIKGEKVWADLFGSWIQRAGGNQYLFGLYNHWDIIPKKDNKDFLVDEPYYLLFRDNDAGLGGGDLTIHTLGNRLAGKTNVWDYAVEAALQLGESGVSDLFAYAAHGHVGYTFDASWKPRIGLEYNLASGDDAPAAGKVKTFNNLLPTNHDKYGYMDVVALRNIHNPRVSFQVQPTDKWTASLDYHLFFLMEPASGLFQATGAQVRAGAPGISSFAGQEIDALVKYKWNKWAQFLVGYSYFKTGGFFEDTAGSTKDAHFIYAQTVVNFDVVVKE